MIITSAKSTTHAKGPRSGSDADSSRFAAQRKRRVRIRNIEGAPAPRLCQRGNLLVPIRKASTAWAHWRPSRIAQTTRDWPRRMSPQAKMFSEVVL
jgi:hypothetical protein